MYIYAYVVANFILIFKLSCTEVAGACMLDCTHDGKVYIMLCKHLQQVMRACEFDSCLRGTTKWQQYASVDCVHPAISLICYLTEYIVLLCQ